MALVTQVPHAPLVTPSLPTDPRPEADPPTSEDPLDGAQAAGEPVLLTPRLGAMTLGSSSAHPAGPSA